MFRVSLLPLLLVLSLFLVTACGAATGAEPAQEASPLEQSPAQPNAEAAGEPDTPAEPEAYPPPLAGDAITAGTAVTGTQPLVWGADDENCIVPGLVITGPAADLPPCEPVPADGDAQTGMQEGAQEDAMPEEPAQSSQENAHIAEMTALAEEDLAQRLGISPDQIEVSEVRAVTWPDASLGCPEPDMMYAQVIQEGLLIRLSAGGETYAYHSGGNRPPFLCEESMQVLPPDAGQ